MDNVINSVAQNSGGIPLWVWVVAVIIVIIVAIIWTLREEESAQKSTSVRPVKRTVIVQEPVAATQEAVIMSVLAEDVAPNEVEQLTVAEVVDEVKPTQSQTKTRVDNLKRVKGIGPKIEKLLKDNGISTFVQLAQTEVSRLQALLDEAEYALPDPTTWPEQAQELAS